MGATAAAGLAAGVAADLLLNRNKQKAIKKFVSKKRRNNLNNFSAIRVLGSSV